jgi:hypothetical protein
MMMKLNVVVLLAMLVMPGQAVKDDPVARVVVLIKELMAKIESDGKPNRKRMTNSHAGVRRHWRGKQQPLMPQRTQ